MSSDESTPQTVHVEKPPTHYYGNLLWEGPDGRCAFYYDGIDERCSNEVAAHTFVEHGDEMVRIEMCAEHAREDVPDTGTDQQELVTDGGSDYLNCPECPECDSREQKFRFDTDRHIGVVRCGQCDEDLFVVSVLANKHVMTVKDPMAGSLPKETYESLREKGRLPPVAEKQEVEIDVE